MTAPRRWCRGLLDRVWEAFTPRRIPEGSAPCRRCGGATDLVEYVHFGGDRFTADRCRVCYFVGLPGHRAVSIPCDP